MVHAQPYSVLKESTDGTNFPDAWTFESGNRWLQGFHAFQALGRSSNLGTAIMNGPNDVTSLLGITRPTLSLGARPGKIIPRTTNPSSAGREISLCPFEASN